MTGKKARAEILSKILTGLDGALDGRADQLWQALDALGVREEELSPASMPTRVAHLSGVIARVTASAAGLAMITTENPVEAGELAPKRPADLLKAGKALIEASEAFAQEVSEWLTKS